MDKKRIIIAGGSGFLGKNLHKYFSEKGFEVKILSRSQASNTFLKWDAKHIGAWAEALEGAYALINMTGRTVDCRYNEKNKAEILSSRLESTAILGKAVLACKVPPKHWLNSSTATIYVHTEGEKVANTEANGIIGDDFSMGVAKAWEKEFYRHARPETLQVALRSSIIMGAAGGAFPVMAKLARKGLCSPQGNGQQWISWMHMTDFCQAIMFILEHQLAGPVNMCAPNPVQNFVFNRLLKEHARPWFVIPQPVWVLKVGAWMLRTQTELILKSRKVVPEKLLKAGFEFSFPKAELMVADLFETAIASTSQR
ncbi:MAG TPA: TIGR01777 family protein [Bacteroidetes bacterium]|nr:TIGR01777 family protein [Bacteroidota bacterium]